MRLFQISNLRFQIFVDEEKAEEKLFSAF